MCIQIDVAEVEGEVGNLALPVVVVNAIVAEVRALEVKVSAIEVTVNAVFHSFLVSFSAATVL